MLYLMSLSGLEDAALVLVGHGSTLNADSARPTFQHSDALRQAGVFADVVEAFWKEQPSICGVLRGVWAPRVFVVPLFISDGYFTEQVIPRELGLDRHGSGPGGFLRVQRRGGQRIHYCDPIGTHPGMTRVLRKRAREIVLTNPRPDGQSVSPASTALVIAGHGTGNNENSRVSIENQVERLRSEGEFAEVHPAFMEEPPRIEEIYSLTRQENIVVLPFFISDGLHSFEDIPVLLGESPQAVRGRMAAGQPTWINPTERFGRWVWYGRSVGTEPGLSAVILERVREAAAAGSLESASVPSR